MESVGSPPEGLDEINNGVILCLGMSQAHYECGGDPEKTGTGGWIQNSTVPLPIVDAGISGWDTYRIMADPATYWSLVDRRIQEAGYTSNDVVLVWLKQATRAIFGAGDLVSERNVLTAHYEILQDQTEARFPNMQYGFSSSRIYGGHCRVNPDPSSSQPNALPYAYDTINAVLAAVEDEAKWFLGPYLWADGLNARADGVFWDRGDFIADGCHPSSSGALKVATMNNAFFGQLDYGDGPPPPPPPPPERAQCEDGIDNDRDNLVDMQDPGCDSSSDDDESDEPSPPPPPPPSDGATNLSVFFGGNGTFGLRWENNGRYLRCGATVIPVAGEAATVMLPNDLVYNVKHQCKVDNSNVVRFGCRSPSACRVF